MRSLRSASSHLPSTSSSFLSLLLLHLCLPLLLCGVAASPQNCSCECPSEGCAAAATPSTDVASSSPSSAGTLSPNVMAEESNSLVWDSGDAALPLIITLEAPLPAPPASLPLGAPFFANGSGLVLEPAQAWQVAGKMYAYSSAPGADSSWPLGYGPHGSHNYRLVGDVLQPYGPYRASFRFRSSSARCTPGVVVLYEVEIYDPLHVQASEASILVRGPHASSEATWGAAKSDQGSPWVSLGLVNLCGLDGYLAGEVAVSYSHASLATPLPSLIVDAVRFVRRTPAVASPRLCSDAVSRDISSMDELQAGAQQVKAGQRLRVAAGLLQVPSLDIYGELHVVPDGPLFLHVGRITVHPGGELLVGREGCESVGPIHVALGPTAGDAVVPAASTINQSAAHDQGLQVLLGGRLVVRGDAVTSWETLQQPASAGEDELILGGGARHWRTGSVVAIAASGFLTEEAERFVIVEITPPSTPTGGVTRVRLDRPLRWTHDCTALVGGSRMHCPEILLLSRSIRMSGARSSQGAQIHAQVDSVDVARRHPAVDVAFAEILRLGNGAGGTAALHHARSNQGKASARWSEIGRNAGFPLLVQSLADAQGPQLPHAAATPSVSFTGLSVHSSLAGCVGILDVLNWEMKDSVGLAHGFVSCFHAVGGLAANVSGSVAMHIPLRSLTQDRIASTRDAHWLRPTGFVISAPQAFAENNRASGFYINMAVAVESPSGVARGFEGHVRLAVLHTALFASFVLEGDHTDPSRVARVSGLDIYKCGYAGMIVDGAGLRVKDVCIAGFGAAGLTIRGSNAQPLASLLTEPKQGGQDAISDRPFAVLTNVAIAGQVKSDTSTAVGVGALEVAAAKLGLAFFGDVPVRLSWAHFSELTPNSNTGTVSAAALGFEQFWWRAAALGVRVPNWAVSADIVTSRVSLANVHTAIYFASDDSVQANRQALICDADGSLVGEADTFIVADVPMLLPLVNSEPACRAPPAAVATHRACLCAASECRFGELIFATGTSAAAPLESSGSLPKLTGVFRRTPPGLRRIFTPVTVEGTPTMLKINVLLNCEYYFTPLNAEGGSSFLGVTAVQGLAQDGDYLSVVRSITNADQAVHMFAITDEGPVEVSTQLAANANQGQSSPGLPQVMHDVATDAVTQRFSVVAGHAPLTTLVEEGANQLGSCGDNVCAVGEFTRLYACVSDCHAYYVSFYFVFGEALDPVLASPGMLEVELRQSAVGQDTAITSVPFPGGVAFTVVAPVKGRAQEIEAALEAGEVLVLGAGASRGPAPVVDGGGGGKSNKSVIVVYVVLAVCIGGIVGLATNSARRRHAASRALESGEEDYAGKRSKVRTAVPITFDTRDDVPKGLLSETFLRAATEALQRGEDPADILTAALTSVPCSGLYEQALVCIAVGDMGSLSRVLTQAMQFGGPTGVQRLVQSAPAEGRNTLLMHAVQLLNTDALTLLLSTGASVHARNMRGQTALHLVAQRPEPQAAYLASILLEHGADVNAEDEQGLTPLLLAARFGSATLLGRLLERNVHIDAESLEGRSVVTMALLSSNQEAVQALLTHLDKTDHRLLLDKQDKDGWAPLHWACAIGELATLELLLEQPTINVYTQTRVGETPLHVAAREGNIEVVSSLLCIRPPRAPSQLLTLILQETDADMTAEQLAEANLHSDCTRLISQQKRQLRAILAASSAGGGGAEGVCTAVSSSPVETGEASSPPLSVSTRSDSAHGGTAASTAEDSSSPRSVIVVAAAAESPSGAKNARGTKTTAAAAKAGDESKLEARRRRRRDAWRRRNEVKRRNQTETEETVAHLEAEEQLLQQVVSALVADRQRLMRALGIDRSVADQGRTGHMPMLNDRSPDSGMDEDLVSQRSMPLLVPTLPTQPASARVVTDIESYV